MNNDDLKKLRDICTEGATDNGSHQFIFGDSLEKAAQHISNQAYQGKTRESFLKGAEKLQGIKTLLIFMRGENAPQHLFLTALVALGNEINRLYTAADSVSNKEI